MIKFLLILLFITSFCKAQQTNVVVALAGTLAGEPYLEASFVEGYESVGGTYNGTFTTIELANTFNTFAYAQDNNATLVLRNTGTSDITAKQIDSFHNNGIQYITCNGTNNYHQYSVTNGTLTNIIICGAGETENMTGYPVEFYGIHRGYNFPIISMVQGTGDTLITTVNTSTNGVFYVTNQYRVTFSGVTGFSNNPNGQFQVIKQTTNYTAFSIIHNVGSGSFISGNVSVFYQSYSHAYIAGQIAFVKDSLNCSWWEARYRCRVTASSGNVFTSVNGYGRINVLDAINYSGVIPPDEYNTLGNTATLSATRNQSTFSLVLGTVLNALTYEIYNNDSLLQTIFASSFTNGQYSYTIPRKFKTQGGKNYFHYKAIRGNQNTTSNLDRTNWYKYPYLYIKN